MLLVEATKRRHERRRFLGLCWENWAGMVAGAGFAVLLAYALWMELR